MGLFNPPLQALQLFSPTWTQEFLLMWLASDRHAVSQTGEATILWADFTVIETDNISRICQSGVVRIELDAAGGSVDAAVFERLEER